MITFTEFEKKFEKFAPKSAAPFEFSGIIKGTKLPTQRIRKIALALDLTSHAARVAYTSSCDILIVFHAPDFLSVEIPWQKEVISLSRSGLAIYKAHLRLNFAPKGIHQTLLDLCGFEAHSRKFMLDNMIPIKRGVYQLDKSFSLKQILKKVSILKPKMIKIYNQQHKIYEKILVASGSGFKKEFFEQLSPDMIISGEAKHSALKLAEEYNTTLIELSHWLTEDPPLRVITHKLSDLFRIPVFYISETPKVKYMLNRGE